MFLHPGTGVSIITPYGTAKCGKNNMVCIVVPKDDGGRIQRSVVTLSMMIIRKHILKTLHRMHFILEVADTVTKPHIIDVVVLQVGADNVKTFIIKMLVPA